MMTRAERRRYQQQLAQDAAHDGLDRAREEGRERLAWPCPAATGRNHYFTGTDAERRCVYCHATPAEARKP